MVRPLLPLVLGLVNAGLLVALLLLFLKQYRSVQSKFTGGLLLFAAAFLVQDAARLVAFWGRAGRVRVPFLPELDLLAELLQLVAVATLIYVVTR